MSEQVDTRAGEAAAPAEDADAPRVSQGRRRRVRRRKRKPILSMGNALVALGLLLLAWFAMGVSAGYDVIVVGAMEKTPIRLPPGIASAVWGFPIAAPVLYAVHRTWFWRGTARIVRRAAVALLAIWMPCALLFFFVALS